MGAQLWYTTSYGTQPGALSQPPEWLLTHQIQGIFLFTFTFLRKHLNQLCNLKWHFLNFSCLLCRCYYSINDKWTVTISLGFLCSVESPNTKGLAAVLLYSYYMKHQNMHCDMFWNSENLVSFSWVMPEPLNLLVFFVPGTANSSPPDPIRSSDTCSCLLGVCW